MSFLLASPSPSSGSASTTTSTPDSLAFPPGIAETNLTTVDDASKSHILVPATPSEAGPSAIVPLRNGAAAAVPAGVHTHAAAEALHHLHHRVQSRAQSDETSSPASTATTRTEIAAIAAAHPGLALKLAFADPLVMAERSPTASSSRSSSASPSSSSAGSRGSSVESSSASGELSSSSSSTERSRWPSEDLRARRTRADGSSKGTSDVSSRSALSSTPRVRMSESLLFSHSIPPAAKWKGKEREWDPEREIGKGKGKAREKAPQQHHRRRSSASSTRSKIQTTRGDVVFKYQEQGFSRDFLLIIALCIGLACGFILILRPAMLSLLGRAGSVNFSLDGLD